MKITNKTSSTVKLDIKCSCGTPFSTNFNNFKIDTIYKNPKKQCNNCGLEINKIKQRRTTEEYKQILINKFGEDEYEILEEYINKDTKILTRHKCGYEWKIVPNSLIRSKSPICPQCNYEKIINSRIKTLDQLILEVYNLVGDEYEILSDKYINSQTKILFKHTKHNHTFEMQPNNFLQGQRCSVCFGTHKKTTEQFKEEVFKLVGDEYIILGEYINAREKIQIQHKICESIYNVTPDGFLHNHRCPVCNISKGEIKISNYLINKCFKYIDQYILFKLELNKKIPLDNLFTTQKTFKGLLGLGNGFLSYDFYIPKLNLLIEYQGEYHDMVIKYKNETIEVAEARFKKQLEHDRRKREYAKKHNINLLEIWYWDFDNIEKILDRELEVFNIGK